MSSLGEIVEIILDSDSMKVSSMSANNQLFSKKIQQSNVGKFLQTFGQTPIDNNEVEVVIKSSTEINTIAQITAGMQIGKATMAIITINTLVFIAMIVLSSHDKASDIINSSTQLLTQWGANGANTIIHSEWWRLISSTFLHAGVFHLLANMYALFYLGSLLESRIGTRKFLIAYILSGLIASIASLYFNDSNIISVGASGAIFGLCGVFLLTLIFGIFSKNIGRQLIMSVVIFIAINITSGFSASNIDNMAHIGGLLGGLIVGGIMVASMRVDSQKVGMRIMGVGITFILIGIMISCILAPKTNAFFFSYYNLFESKDQEISRYIQSNLDTNLDSEAKVSILQTTITQWNTAEVSLQKARGDINTPSTEQKEIMNLINTYIENKKKLLSLLIQEEKTMKELQKEQEIKKQTQTEMDSLVANLKVNIGKITSTNNIDNIILNITSQDFIDSFIATMEINSHRLILIKSSPENEIFQDPKTSELQNEIRGLNAYIEQIDISNLNAEQTEVVGILKQYLSISNQLIIVQQRYINIVTKQKPMPQKSILDDNVSVINESLQNLQQKMNSYMNR